MENNGFGIKLEISSDDIQKMVEDCEKNTNLDESTVFADKISTVKDVIKKSIQSYRVHKDMNEDSENNTYLQTDEEGNTIADYLDKYGLTITFKTSAEE